jgi:hypothetical protein
MEGGMMARITLDRSYVMAYRDDGNTRAVTQVNVGDEIDWKRNGTAGAFRCRVEKITANLDLPRRTQCLRCRILSHDGRPADGYNVMVNIRAGILRVHPITRSTDRRE